MDGLLLIDKPSGWTSFDVVAKVRGVVKAHAKQQQAAMPPTTYHLPPTISAKPKVGHTGTLDPLATGLLVLVLGSYCKRAEEFSKLDKTYEVNMKLGQTSTTGDSEGIISPHTKISRLSLVTRLSLEKVVAQFVGEIMQTPPIYSAIKVNGQRAYKLARAGKEVKMEPRKVTVYSLLLTSYNYPEVKFTAKVSSGTYIRSLVEDIGTRLATGAYMSDLRRTTVGDWDISNALGMQNISAETIFQNLLTP